MVVAGRVLDDGDVAIMMVEAEATKNVYEVVNGGGPQVYRGGRGCRPRGRQAVHRGRSAEAQLELKAKSAEGARWSSPVFLDYDDDVLDAVTAQAENDLAEAMTIAGKHERESATDAIKAKTVEALAGRVRGPRARRSKAAFKSLTKSLVRRRVVKDKVRIDGRGLADIRQLAAEVEVLPRVHGSALFERGETQIMGVTTLNMLRMEQMLDTLNPENRKRYMHNYNFPPYSTGETGRVGSPKRREIGHGALAERALVPVLPSREEFPYAIRQVSEALSSNGSTSMGSVCASTMSLLNAGVPLKAPVAGIAMGLIFEGGEYATLTDILGAEDAFGDMDFKVAGTPQFVTALQLDTKLDGIPASVLAAALQQARTARLAILEVMNEAIDEPDEMSPYAPRVISVKIPVDKIGEVIGPKGKMINQIQDDTGADITIEDDGTIYIGATSGTAAEAAMAVINQIANPTMPKVGERFLGTVVKTAAFGAFVSLVPAATAWCTSASWATASASARSRTSSTSATSCRSRSPRSTSAARSASPRSRTPPLSPPRRSSTQLPRAGPAVSAFRRTVLPGGLRVVTEAVPGVRSAAFGRLGRRRLARRAPARGRRVPLPRAPAVQGHDQARDALEIAAVMDAVGGELNAFTAKEYTCYYARVLDDDLPLAVDVVSDLVTVGAGRAGRRRERARGVILEEISMHDDDPGDVVHDAFAEAALRRPPARPPVIGSVESIEALTAESIAGYYRSRYRAPHMVVSVAGNLDHDTVVRAGQ